MISGRDQLKDLIARWCPGDGVHASPVPGISCIKVSRPQPRAKRHWRASFCIAVQGTKEILLEGQVYREREPHYIVSPIDLPVTSRVVGVSPAQPLLSLKMDFDAVALRDVAAQLDRTRPDDLEHEGRAIFIGKASDRMLDAAIRLGALFEAPDDATVLAPLVTKELIFHLLKGPDGPAIRQLVRAGSQAHRIAAAVHHLQAALDADVDIAALARTAGMSRAAFFKRFKEATAMSPLQYQKRLRLLEARRLMVEEGVGAEASAFRVGYTSASQFSREYSRMFGNPPRRDARALQQTAAVVQDM
ncbi:AraC family transcriptional regulator [Sorangium cellulosum]|uniref:AraC family transcriptional regulator n=1 Tax=Sorangium cellulosum TaxID=56 RepID=A0A150R6I9_SORCE|nr:AraC family transcriptional regulator [Sorangium cellulosum]